MSRSRQRSSTCSSRAGKSGVVGSGRCGVTGGVILGRRLSSTAMDDIEILLALLAVAAAAVWVARALQIPYPFLLVLAGVGVGYLPGVSEIEVEPDVIFLVFLPPLLHAAGWLS